MARFDGMSTPESLNLLLKTTELFSKRLLDTTVEAPPALVSLHKAEGRD